MIGKFSEELESMAVRGSGMVIVSSGTCELASIVVVIGMGIGLGLRIVAFAIACSLPTLALKAAIY